MEKLTAKNEDGACKSPSGDFNSELATFNFKVVYMSIMQQIDINVRECQVLILTSTHDSAQELFQNISALSPAECFLCIGGARGTRLLEEVRKFESGVHLVVGTIGRILDLANRNALKTAKINFVLEQNLLNDWKENTCKLFKKLPSDMCITVVSKIGEQFRIGRHTIKNEKVVLRVKKEMNQSIFDVDQRVFINACQQEMACLFCDVKDTNLDHLKIHMKRHGVDFAKETTDLSTNDCMKIVNFVRRKTSTFDCIKCGEKFQDNAHLVGHLNVKNHFTLGDRHQWDAPENLWPLHPFDAFLSSLEDVSTYE